MWPGKKKPETFPKLLTFLRGTRVTGRSFQQRAFDTKVLMHFCVLTSCWSNNRLAGAFWPTGTPMNVTVMSYQWFTLRVQQTKFQAFQYRKRFNASLETALFDIISGKINNAVWLQLWVQFLIAPFPKRLILRDLQQIINSSHSMPSDKDIDITIIKVN